MATTQDKKKSAGDRIMHHLMYRPYVSAISFLVLYFSFELFASVLKSLILLGFALSGLATVAWVLMGRKKKPAKK